MVLAGGPGLLLHGSCQCNRLLTYWTCQTGTPGVLSKPSSADCTCYCLTSNADAVLNASAALNYAA